MLSGADLERLVTEAAPALAGGVVHRIWREGEDSWVLLLRHETPVFGRDRVAFEVGLDPTTARIAARPGRAEEKKDDSHFFVTALRKTLGGCKVERLAKLKEDRVLFLDTAGPKRPRLAIELTGRSANLVLVERGEEGERVILALNPGRAGRDLDPGKPYVAPPPRPPREGAAEELFEPEIEPNPETLALSEAVAARAREIAEAGEAAERRELLLRAATNAEKRARGLVEKLEKERDEAIAAEKLRQQGELLKANAAKVKRGDTRVKVLDFFQEPPVEVELEVDPLEPVMDQARALFKRAKKLDRGLVTIETRLGAMDAEKETLARVRAELEAASPEDTETLDRCERELEKLGAAPKKKVAAPKKKEPERPSGPRRFVSRDGFEILVGRSNEENDRLTIQMAHGNDLFFHVRGFPGSHVIVRQKRDKSYPLETLLDAGALAVHYSKVRGNVRADVSYTPRKYVRKPRGAKPGLVEISNEKTIRPDGDPARLARLLATAGGDARDDDHQGDVE